MTEMKAHERKRQALLLAVWIIAQSSKLQAQSMENDKTGSLPAEGENNGIYKNQNKQQNDADSTARHQNRL